MNDSSFPSPHSDFDSMENNQNEITLNQHPKQNLNQPKGNNVFSSILVIFIFIGFAYYSGVFNNYGSKLEFNQGEIYFKTPVTEEQVRKAGNVLIEIGFFDGRPKSVQILKKDEIYHIRFVVREDFELSPDIKNAFRLIGLYISNGALDNSVFEVHLCDSTLKSFEVIQNKDKLEKFNNGDVFFNETITNDEAKKVGESLQKQKYFDGINHSISLSKKGSIYKISFVVAKAISPEDPIAQKFKEYGLNISSEALNGATVEVFLCDTTFHELMKIE